jgi:hypothetical protein
MERTADAPAFARRTASRPFDAKRNEPLAGRDGRESITTRKLNELELLVRRVAALDPFYETVDDEQFCAFCEARGRRHNEDCAWLTCSRWVQRNLP